MAANADYRSGKGGEETPLVHKVVVPPKGSIVKEIGYGVKETFFYDAPVAQFRGKSGGTKVILGLKFLFPILDWLSTYTPRKAGGDLLAGLTIASLAVPQVRTNTHTHTPQITSLLDLSIWLLHIWFFSSTCTNT
jgi:hypothetical protein